MILKLGSCKIRTNFNFFIVALMLTAEVCFYTAQTIALYMVMTVFAILASFLHNRNCISFRIKLNGFAVWVVGIYVMYFLYGILYLQRGVFPWYTIGYRGIEIIALYISISAMFTSYIDDFRNAVEVAGVVSFMYLLCCEGSSIIAGNVRIGESLSGNVNTVGYAFGMMATVVMLFYCKNIKRKNKMQIPIFLLFSVVTLLTGSKKALLLLLIDYLVYFWHERKKISGWMVTAFLLTAVIYAVFNIPYFYNIIGFRIDTMFETLLHGKSSTSYSYSTDIRGYMIREAFDIFQKKPLFGGGWNRYYSMTSTVYEYCHCNPMELLCSFGIVGTALFYSRHLQNLLFVIKRKTRNKEITLNLKMVIVALTCTMLVLDWGAVTFSAQCIWYLPLIISAAAIDAFQAIDN